MEILKRSKQAFPDLLDLSEYYNGYLDENIYGTDDLSFSNIPSGLQIYSNVAFDVRGIIQLAGNKKYIKNNTDYPVSVTGISVNTDFRKLHFLHGSAGVEEEGMKIGYYLLNYKDGRKRTVPIIYGKNTKTVTADTGDLSLTDADVAWKGYKNNSSDCELIFYKYTVNNPLPDAELNTIDFISELTGAAPFLLAVTVEPVETIYLNFSDGSKPVNTVMPRNQWADKRLVDLSDYYTASLDDDWHNHEGHDLQNVPKGIQVFGDVAFDVRGLIQVAAGNISLRRTGSIYPESIRGIKVEQCCNKLHFLHACGWFTDMDVEIGEYVINYTDVEKEIIPLVYGRNTADWWETPDNDFDENTEVVWKGDNSFCHNLGVKVQLLKFSWSNPHVDRKIASIDINSHLETAGQFLVAVTAE